MGETSRKFRSRVALLKITLRQLVSDQPTTIMPFAAQRSPFLQLPRELRDLIYCFVLGSTRVSFGRRGDSGMKPAPHSLAVLRVCRQVHQEARSLWLGQILVSFEDTYSLLDKLSSIPPDTLPQIRHIRTGGRALFLAPGTQVHRREYYSHVWALKFFPELSLDRLTVLGVPDGRENYNFLDELIKYGHGWRELHFFAQDSKLFGFARLSHNVSTGVPLQRRPQPSNWNEILRRRDGAESQCSVTIYRSEDAPAPGVVLKPQILDAQKRWTFEQSPAPDELGVFGIEEDEQLMADSEVGKEILVVVKRGRDADIRGLDTAPYKGADMRQWANGKAWRRIKREWTMPAAKWIAKRVEVDSYTNVDDFMWSTFRESPRNP